MSNPDGPMTPNGPLTLDGKATAQQIRDEVKTQVAALVAQGHRPPGLAAVLVGDDPASKVYVGSKTRACEEAGLVGRTVIRPASTREDELMALIDDLNADDAIDGILVQLPLPKHIDPRRALERVDPSKDVDGFHSANVGAMWLDQPGFLPATPSGVMEMLHRYDIPLKGKNAVVLGRSFIVGKPMAALLLRENATVTICHSRTHDLPAVCRQADILVAAVGRPGMVDASYVKDGAVVIDVGINQLTDEAEVQRLFGEGNGGAVHERKLRAFAKKGSVLVGDVHYQQVKPKASAITPVPGGVGPLTVAMLLVNTLKACRRHLGLPEAPEST